MLTPNNTTTHYQMNIENIPYTCVHCQRVKHSIKSEISPGNDDAVDFLWCLFNNITAP